jgi:hypothetical protein
MKRGSSLQNMKMGNWPNDQQKLAKIGHFKTLKWPPIGQNNTAFLPLIYQILNISMHFLK